MVRDVLTRVTMVGNDLKLDDGVGTCGKEGQSVPVGVGQPRCALDGLDRGRHGLNAAMRGNADIISKHCQSQRVN